MARYDDILLKLYEILRPYTQDGQILSESTELIKDLDLDSMKVMQLLLEIEDRFDISIPLNIVANVQTVRDFARQIEQFVKQQ